MEATTDDYRCVPLFRCEGVLPSPSGDGRSLSGLEPRSPPGPTEQVELGGVRRAGAHAAFENFIASTSIFVEKESQATKGQRWMPCQQEPMKDAGGCEKPRVDAYQSVIRGYPNGATHQPSWAGTPL